MSYRESSTGNGRSDVSEYALPLALLSPPLLLGLGGAWLTAAATPVGAADRTNTARTGGGGEPRTGMRSD